MKVIQNPQKVNMDDYVNPSKEGTFMERLSIDIRIVFVSKLGPTYN